MAASVGICPSNVVDIRKKWRRRLPQTFDLLLTDGVDRDAELPVSQDQISRLVAASPAARLSSRPVSHRDRLERKHSQLATLGESVADRGERISRKP
jgi:hypothetical protein